MLIYGLSGYQLCSIACDECRRLPHLGYIHVLFPKNETKMLLLIRRYECRQSGASLFYARIPPYICLRSQMFWANFFLLVCQCLFAIITATWHLQASKVSELSMSFSYTSFLWRRGGVGTRCRTKGFDVCLETGHQRYLFTSLKVVGVETQRCIIITIEEEVEVDRGFLG